MYNTKNPQRLSADIMRIDQRGNVDNGFAPACLMLGKSLEHKKTLLGVGEFSNPFLGGGTFTRPGFSLVKIFVSQPKLLLLQRLNARHSFPNQKMLLPN